MNWIIASAAAVAIAVSVSATAEPLSEGRTLAAIDRAIEGGRLIQARAMLDANLISSPFERDRLRGELALAQHRDQNALSLFETLHGQKPEDCRLSAGLATAAMRLERYAEAEPALSATVKLCPDRATSWSQFAALRDLQGRWAESETFHRRALALQPDDPALLNNAGTSMLAQQRFEDARRYFAGALALVPGEERYRNNLDIALVASGAPLPIDQEIEPERRAQRLNNAGYAALMHNDRAAAAGYLNDAIATSTFRFTIAEANREMLNKEPSP